MSYIYIYIYKTLLQCKHNKVIDYIWLQIKVAMSTDILQLPRHYSDSNSKNRIAMCEQNSSDFCSNNKKQIV